MEPMSLKQSSSKEIIFVEIYFFGFTHSFTAQSFRCPVNSFSGWIQVPEWLHQKVKKESPNF